MNLSHAAFKLDGAPVSVSDVLAASFVGGWLGPVEARLRDELAAGALAAEAGVEISGDDLEAPLDAWRAERDLIAAEELEQWLESRELGLEDLCEFLELRLLAARRWPPAEKARVAPEIDDIRARIPATVTFSGELDRLTLRFAKRCVAPVVSAADEASVQRRARVQRELLAARNADSLADLEAALEVFELPPARLPWVVDVEVNFLLFSEDALAFSKLKAGLADFGDDLVRYELMSTVCPTEDVAREVLCCVRVDHDPFTRSVARADLPCRRQEIFASAAPGVPFGHRLASASPRDVFGPEPAHDGHVVVQLVARHEPDLSNPEVVTVLSERILDRSLKRALADRVRFPDPEQA